MKGCVREVVWAHPPTSAPTQEPWDPLAPGTTGGSSLRHGGARTPGGPRALSHCASLLSRELIAQVPACTPRPCPLCFPVSPGVPGLEPRAERRQARAHVSGGGSQNPDSSGTRAPQTPPSSRGAGATWLAREQLHPDMPGSAGGAPTRRQAGEITLGGGRASGALPRGCGALTKQRPGGTGTVGSGL